MLKHGKALKIISFVEFHVLNNSNEIKSLGFNENKNATFSFSVE